MQNLDYNQKHKWNTPSHHTRYEIKLLETHTDDRRNSKVHHESAKNYGFHPYNEK